MEQPDMTCIICGSSKMIPIPFERHQEAEIWQSNRKGAVDETANWTERRRIARIGADRSWEMFSGLHKGSSKGRFLDIACGLGLTVKQFQDNGWLAEGNDIDATVKPIHDELGIRTRIGPVESENWEEPFDLIQVAYAIYFITDPRAYIERLRHLLKPGGHLAIVMADHLAYTCQGGPAYMHTFIPTMESMEGLLARAGYKTVLRRKISDTWFIAATPGEAEPPKIDAKAILRAHRSRAMRWKLFGANRARLRALASRLLTR
jgi:SAM-dependent methyltransferase